VAPAYYKNLFSPFALSLYVGNASTATLIASTSQDGQRGTYRNIIMCCITQEVNPRTGVINASAARLLISRTIQYHAADILNSKSSDASSKAGAGSLIRVLLIQRQAPPWSDSIEGRRISNFEKLLQQCNHASGLHCSSIYFEQLSFPQSLRALRESDVLVGVHGAGIANGIFLRHGSLVVEIFSSGFLAAGRPGFPVFGESKHTHVRTLGIGYRRIVASETDSWCRQRQSKGNFRDAEKEHLRDCDLTVKWEELDRAIRVGTAKPSGDGRT